MGRPSGRATGHHLGPPRLREEHELSEALDVLVREADMVGPGGADVSELLARLEAMDPDWFALADLVDIAPEDLSPDDALAYLRIVVAHQGWLESLSARALVAAAGRVPGSDEVLGSDGRRSVTIDDAVREEVAAALRLAPVTAQGRIEVARTLVTHLPQTHLALQRGRIGAMHARVVAESVQQVAPESANGFARELEERVLARAMRGTVGDVRSAVRSAARRIDPALVSERARRARRDLDVRVWHDDTGVSTLSARLLTEQALAVASAIEEVAHDGRHQTLNGPGVISAGERRAEALVALILRVPGEVVGPLGAHPAAGSDVHSGSGAESPPSGVHVPGATVGVDSSLSVGAGLEAGEVEPMSAVPRTPSLPPAHMVLVMDLPTLLALRDDPVAVLRAGNVPAEVARALAADATFRRAIVDPLTGQLLDYGRRTYAVPDPLRRFIELRDRVCRFPGCNRAADQCQIDHAVAWDDGGHTSAANTGALCQRHHQLKTHGGWRIVESHVDGSCRWRSPLGREYLVEPPTLMEPELVSPPVEPDECVPPDF
ncbi:MAG: DUF222 domain-containing protein [Actinobacteria bacterium]|nr:DUF222 domain-containing protein [Actinomycetota bacterium]